MARATDEHPPAAAAVVTAVEAWAPLHQTAPGWSDTDGDLARQLATDMGWNLDGVQGWTVDAALAVDPGEGLPTCREVCIVGPRQTVGKTVALQVLALFDVFISGIDLHVWTAHRYSTSEKTYLDMRRRIAANRDYARRCDFREKTGQQAIVVDDGASVLEFHARSGAKAGRGFTTSRLTLDEWLFGRPGDLGALAPTIVTMPDAQIRYGSSAGLPESRALRGLRQRGRDGGDPYLAYVELGAERKPCAADGDLPPADVSLSRCRHDLEDGGCALNDRRLWWQANSGLWSGRVREQDVAHERRVLHTDPQAGPREFAREFLSWWEDPPEEGGGAFDPEVFAGLADPDARRGSPVWFGVAVAPDRSWSAVAVAWRRPGGGVHVVVPDYRPHASWLADRVPELRRAWGGTVVVDSRARDLIDGAREPSEQDQALAEAVLSDAVTARTLSHGNEPELLTAVGGAVWQQTGAHRRLMSSGRLDVSPIRAVALAVHAASQSADPLQQVW